RRTTAMPMKHARSMNWARHVRAGSQRANCPAEKKRPDLSIRSQLHERSPDGARGGGRPCAASTSRGMGRLGGARAMPELSVSRRTILPALHYLWLHLYETQLSRVSD